jgi:hypothetical protein
MDIGRANTRLHFVENSLWKRLGTCPKRQYVMMMMMMMRMMMMMTVTWSGNNSSFIYPKVQLTY